MRPAAPVLRNAPARIWLRLGSRLLPFADAASPELPLARLLRLALFQVSVGMAVVLLNGTLNRVMIVELAVPAWLVSLMIALPLLFAPLRALIGFRSDNYRSALGWRRAPFIWFGSLLQFGGLAIMPFALIVLSGDTHGPAWIGQAGAALAFLLVGAGLHTTQTAGLALANDLAPGRSRPRAVALLYVMLLLGMIASSLLFGALLAEFSQIRLIQVIQGAALATLLLNTLALWKQEPRRPSAPRRQSRRPAFLPAWRRFVRRRQGGRFLFAVGLGTAGFSMQDILLEPYGAEILQLSVSATTVLTALLAAGMLAGFACAAWSLGRGVNVHRLAAVAALTGIVGLSAVIFSAPLASAAVFRAGTLLIGCGSGLFAVATLSAAMALGSERGGLALGAWGAVQASAAGIGIALGGALRDLLAGAAERGALGVALADAAIPYSVVYHIEIALLFAALIALGPLVGPTPPHSQGEAFGLAEFPG